MKGRNTKLEKTVFRNRTGSTALSRSDSYKQRVRIGDVHQKEGIARHRRARTAAVFLLDNATEAVDIHLAAAHFEQGSYHGPNHVAQETVGTDGKDPRHVVHLRPGSLHDAAVVGLHVRMQLAEAGEVGIVEQRTGRLVHPVEVGALEKSATILPVKRILGRRNVILVHARGGIKAGMCFGLHRPQAVHRDIRRQQAVQLVGHENFVQRTVGIKMGHHERSMYPRIRTPGPHYADLAAQQRRQRPLAAPASRGRPCRRKPNQ